jgi:hypothetical protein
MATINTSLVVTRDNGTVVTLPYPQEYTPDIYDVDAATTGRNAAGTMIRDRVARKHKFNCKWAALSHDQLTLLLQATQDSAFNLTAVDIFTGTRRTFRVYVGDRSAPVYWYPTSNTNTWMYVALTMNFIEL